MIDRRVSLGETSELGAFASDSVFTNIHWLTHLLPFDCHQWPIHGCRLDDLLVAISAIELGGGGHQFLYQFWSTPKTPPVPTKVATKYIPYQFIIGIFVTK